MAGMRTAVGVKVSLLLASALLATGCTTAGGKGGLFSNEPPRPDPQTVWPPYSIWIVRQAWESPDQITTLMEQCYQAGFNTVLFQVRGDATVHYPSKIEPWDPKYGGEPGFDPLEIACREAHRRGMAIQAWVNVMPAWRGKTPPENPDHLYHTHPEWYWYDQHGKRQPLDDFYVSVNPCLPEVRAYLVDVFEEIVKNYPVDGLHLDYIRFPTDVIPQGTDYPHDSRTLELYRKATGKRPGDDEKAWTQWRIEQVTTLVADIRSMMRRKAKGVQLTASCGPIPDHTRSRYYQDGPRWVRERLIDVAYVMNYTADTSLLKQRQEVWRAEAGNQRVALGIGIYKHDSPQTTLDQIELASKWGDGFAIFSNNALLTNRPKDQRFLQAIQPTLLMLRDSARVASRQAPPRAETVADSSSRQEPVRPYGIMP